MSLFEKSQYCKLCGEYSYGPCKCKEFYCTIDEPETIEDWEHDSDKINAKSAGSAAVKFCERSDIDGWFEGTRTVFVRLGIDGAIKRIEVESWLEPSYEASEVVEWVAK